VRYVPIGPLVVAIEMPDEDVLDGLEDFAGLAGAELELLPPQAATARATPTAATAPPVRRLSFLRFVIRCCSYVFVVRI
jgi:hypothetical protein